MSDTQHESPEERPHAEFGPSGLKELHKCRGFLSNNEETDATRKGTRIHLALELDNPAELTDEEEYLIYEQCKSDLEHARGQMYVMSGVSNPIRHSEKRLHINLGAVKTFGTTDVLDLYGEYGLLYDFKSGVSFIDAPPGNWQSKAYAIGAFQEFPQLNHIFAEFSVPVRHETPQGWYHRAELDQYIADVGSLIIEARYVRQLWASLGTVPGEVLSPGDQCRYCLRQINNECPAMGAIVFDVARRYDAGGLLPETGSIHGSEVDDPETLARLYPVALMVEKWAGGIKHKAKSVAIENGGLGDVYEIKSAGAPRVVSDAKAAIEYSQSVGLSIEELMGVASFSLNPLLDLVKEKTPRGKKTEAARDFESGLEAFGAITRQAERFKLVSRKGGSDED